MKPPLVVEIPGLLQAPPGYYLHDEQALPSWRRFLAATRVGLDQDLSLAAQLGQPLPLANTLQQHDEAESWLLAAPVHLKADINNAILIPYAAATAQQLLEALQADFNQWFANELVLKIQQGIGYLGVLKRAVPQDLADFRRVQGRKLEQFLHHQPEWREWRQLLNEMQMFLHTWSAEHGALFENALPCNSLWLWGFWNKNARLDSDSIPMIHNDDALERRCLEALNIRTKAAESGVEKLQHLRWHGLHADLEFKDWQAQMSWLEQHVIKPILASGRRWQLHCENFQGQGRLGFFQSLGFASAARWQDCAALNQLEQEW